MTVIDSPAHARAGRTKPAAPSGTDRSDEATLFLGGDVMTGRGIDQVLPHPVDPRIFESCVRSAAGYVTLAEEVNGPISKPVDFGYVWGDALRELDRRRPDARLINLETAVTTSDEAEPKGINYRMNPRNAPVLTAAGIGCCVLANNHVLDWGERGLIETLVTLENAGLQTAGAGRSRREARRPAVLPVVGGRLLVFACGFPSSGIPPGWMAEGKRAGVNLLSQPDADAVKVLAADVRAVRRAGDVVLVSIHWGGNWGYDIPREQRNFAHDLIDRAGVDIVWGHSSHHPKAIEVHKGRLILFGCGDFLNDYEGIGGYEEFRNDLAIMYLPTVRLRDGALRRLVMVPFQIRGFSLHRASRRDREWLRSVLSREGQRYGTRVVPGTNDDLNLQWSQWGEPGVGSTETAPI